MARAVRTRKGLRLTIPARLFPYLNDMLDGGLYGLTMRHVVVEALQRQIRVEIARGAIPLRVHGRAVRRVANSYGAAQAQF